MPPMTVVCPSFTSTVVFARCASLRGDGSDQTARHRAQGLAFPHWSQLAQIIDDLEPEQGDIVLTKTGSGCFTSTNLDRTSGGYQFMYTYEGSIANSPGVWSVSAIPEPATAARYAVMSL